MSERGTKGYNSSRGSNTRGQGAPRGFSSSRGGSNTRGRGSPRGFNPSRGNNPRGRGGPPRGNTRGRGGPPRGNTGGRGAPKGYEKYLNKPAQPPQTVFYVFDNVEVPGGYGNINLKNVKPDELDEKSRQAVISQAQRMLEAFMIEGEASSSVSKTASSSTAKENDKPEIETPSEDNKKVEDNKKIEVTTTTKKRAKKPSAKKINKTD